MPPRRPIPKALRAVAVAIVWGAGAFLLGYFGFGYAHDVRVPLVALAAAVVPFGATARSTARGLARGVGLGLMAAGGIVWAMLVGPKTIPPQDFDRIALTYAAAAVFLAAAVASLLALLAERRRRRTRRTWGE